MRKSRVVGMYATAVTGLAMIALAYHFHEWPVYVFAGISLAVSILLLLRVTGFIVREEELSCELYQVFLSSPIVILCGKKRLFKVCLKRKVGEPQMFRMQCAGGKRFFVPSGMPYLSYGDIYKICHTA